MESPQADPTGRLHLLLLEDLPLHLVRITLEDLPCHLHPRGDHHSVHPRDRFLPVILVLLHRIDPDLHHQIGLAKDTLCLEDQGKDPLHQGDLDRDLMLPTDQDKVLPLRDLYKEVQFQTDQDTVALILSKD